MLRSADLFSGIGGMALGVHGYATPRLYCDIDAYCRDYLTGLFARRLLPRARVEEDVKKLTSAQLDRERVDLISAGFPCTGFSVVGKQQGFADDRSSLYFEVLRLARGMRRKPIIFLENVPSIEAFNGSSAIRSQLESLGYVVREVVLCAYEAGPYLLTRKRWFCLAVPATHAKTVAKLATRARAARVHPTREREPKRWSVFPGIGDERKDYLAFWKCIGNTVIPAQARYAFEALCCAHAGLDEPRARLQRPTRVINTISSLNVARELWPSPTTVYTRSKPNQERTTRYLDVALIYDDRTRAEISAKRKVEPKRNLTQQFCPSRQWLLWLMGYPATWCIQEQLAGARRRGVS